MTDTDVLRQVLSYCSANLEIAESFYDAAVVMVLTQIIEIIEGGVSDSDARAVSDSTGSSG